MNEKNGSVDVGFQNVLTEVYEVKSLGNQDRGTAEINSSVFEMNGFMSEAFENPEGLFFENVSISQEGLKHLFQSGEKH